jgi:hypothetical protein
LGGGGESCGESGGDFGLLAAREAEHSALQESPADAPFWADLGESSSCWRTSQTCSVLVDVPK